MKEEIGLKQLKIKIIKQRKEVKTEEERREKKKNRYAKLNRGR